MWQYHTAVKGLRVSFPSRSWNKLLKQNQRPWDVSYLFWKALRSIEQREEGGGWRTKDRTPSSSWEAGGLDHAGPGDPGRRWQGEGSNCFLLQPPSSLPVSLIGGTWLQVTRQSAPVTQCAGVSIVGTQSRREKDRGWIGRVGRTSDEWLALLCYLSWSYGCYLGLFFCRWGKLSSVIFFFFIFILLLLLFFSGFCHTLTWISQWFF